MQADLHETYGIDTGDEQLMTTRSWPWLRTRVRGLLNHPTRPTRISVALTIDQGGTDVA